MSLHVPGKMTTPNLMKPPPWEFSLCLASFASAPCRFYYAGPCFTSATAWTSPPRFLELASVVLDHRIGQELLAHLVEPRLGARAIGLVERQIEDLPHAQLPHLGEAQALESLADGRSLRVQHPRPQPDHDAGFHGAASPVYTRPTRRNTVSTWRRYQAGSKQAFSASGASRAVTPGSSCRHSRKGRRSRQARMAARWTSS